MTETRIHTLLLILVLLGLPLILDGQQAPDASLLRSPLFREKLMLTTDRALYAAGDRILFRIFNASEPLLKENQWSMVIYLELINDRQVAVSRGKFLFGARGTSGQMTIPDTVATGNYYLRTYTRWMRNFTATAFATLPVGVINPLKPGPAGGMRSASDSVPSKSLPFGESFPLEWGSAETGIWCVPERLHYRKRDRIAVRIRAEEGFESTGGVAVSVAKKNFTDSLHLGLSALGHATIGADGSVTYAPETKGVSISGKIVRREDRMPVSFARLHMTLLGDSPDYVALVADQQGEILFNVPLRPGVNNALIAFDPEKGASQELVLDEAFSREFPATSVRLRDFLQQRPEAVGELMMHAQLREAFDLRNQGEDTQADSLTRVLFYGTPEYRYFTTDYVALPTLQEFFFELVPQVSVQRYRGQHTLSVMDDAGYFLEYTPLILLDHVAMQDMDALLSIEPVLLKNIDVVNKVYIRGSNIYGGIISIFSNEGNLAGAGPPEGATIIELQSVEGEHKPWPQAFTLPSSEERLPDLRTTLYWEPEKQLTATEESLLEFQASDIPGTYVLTVTGVTPDRKVIRGRCEFVVE